MGRTDFFTRVHSYLIHQLSVRTHLRIGIEFFFYYAFLADVKNSHTNVMLFAFSEKGLLLIMAAPEPRVLVVEVADCRLASLCASNKTNREIQGE